MMTIQYQLMISMWICVQGLANMSKLSAVDESSASTLGTALLPFMCLALAVCLYLQASPF